MNYLEVCITHKDKNISENIRLLKEIEKEVEEKIFDSIKTKNNNFECVVHFMDNHIYCILIAKICFTLNNKNYVITLEFNKDTSQETIFKTIIDAISNEIASSCIKDIFKDMKIKGYS